MSRTTSESKNPQFYCIEDLEDILLKMISYEAELKIRVAKLTKLIELSLEKKDRNLFIESTNELNSINDYLNS